MDAETQAKIDEIWAILHASATRGTEMEKRLQAAHDRAMKRMEGFDRRMEVFDRRMKESDRRWEARFAKAEQRMDKADKQIQITRKLVEAGIKMVSNLAQDTRELKRAQKAFLDSFGSGGNGNGHKRSN